MDYALGCKVGNDQVHHAARGHLHLKRITLTQFKVNTHCSMTHCNIACHGEPCKSQHWERLKDLLCTVCRCRRVCTCIRLYTRRRVCGTWRCYISKRRRRRRRRRHCTDNRRSHAFVMRWSPVLSAPGMVLPIIIP